MIRNILKHQLARYLVLLITLVPVFNATSQSHVTNGIQGIDLKIEETIMPVNANSIIEIKAGDKTETLEDIDGNVYQTVTIGTQIWMAENLKTTRLNNGSLISLVTENDAWYNLYSAAYCWYNNDSVNNAQIYGAMYNWHAVNTGKLCPAGWHVPSDEEWTILTTFLGGENTAGGILKTPGTDLWHQPNVGATNEFGFSANPGGFRNYEGTFRYKGKIGFWWSTTNEPWGYLPWYRRAYNAYSDLSRCFAWSKNGFSVRCIKD